MNYSIPITESNKSQIENIKRLNDLIKAKRLSVRANEELPKTPTGRTTKSVRDHIKNLTDSLDMLVEQRIDLLNALRQDIHDHIIDISKARAIALIPNDSKFLIAVSDSIDSDGIKRPLVAKSENKEFFVKAIIEYNGSLRVSVDDVERSGMFGHFELRLSNEKDYLRHYDINNFIESYKFQFTDYGLEFTTSVSDKYGLYTYQVNDLNVSDVDMLIKILGELNTLQIHLNKNSDLHCLAMLTRVYSYVEKVFDLEIK